MRKTEVIACILFVACRKHTLIGLAPTDAGPAVGAKSELLTATETFQSEACACTDWACIVAAKTRYEKASMGKLAYVGEPDAVRTALDAAMTCGLKLQPGAVADASAQPEPTVSATTTPGPLRDLREGSDLKRHPILRQGVVSVNGRLPPEVVQRIVRQNFGRFRLCYETGLRSNPGLEGRVSVKFVIAHDGSVSLAADAGSDLPDATVVSCVIGSFRNLEFPQPEGGIVAVVYPIIFSPGDS